MVGPNRYGGRMGLRATCGLQMDGTRTGPRADGRPVPAGDCNSVSLREPLYLGVGDRDQQRDAFANGVERLPPEIRSLCWRPSVND